MRRTYIDWLRGLAVLFMIEWHAVDAWTRLDARDSEAFGWLIFFGGWAAPMFLFLAGVSVALGGEAKMARVKGVGSGAGAPGDSRPLVSWALQKRGWEIFLIAHLFRLFSLLLSPGSRWSGVFKPDILNILGLGLVGAAWCWGRIPAADDRSRPEVRTSKFELRTWTSLALSLLVPAAAIILLAPASRVWWWPTLLYPRLEAYIRPLGNLGVFYLFPTVAYVFIGTFVGAVIAARREAGAERRFHALLGIAGVVLLLAGWAGSYLPPISSRSEFYTTSISLVVIRAGAMTAALAAAWLWMRRPTAGHWSPLVLFGRASLFVYLVHVPLAYGAFSSPLHYALSLPAALAAYGLLTAVMLALAAWWPTRNKTEWIPARLRADWAPHQP
jgi:uncharacterized membrane protein